MSNDANVFFFKEDMNHGINLSKHKTIYQTAQKFHIGNIA